MKNSFLLLCVCAGVLPAATNTYTSLPYRGRGDSPFYSTILRGETFVETFEDNLLNTPGLALTVGRVSTTGRNSVDEDDGRMDNLGVGFHWLVSGAVLPGQTIYTNEILFEKNSSGNYPTHAGLAILGFVPNDLGDTRVFQAFDSEGRAIPEAFLSASVPIYSGISSTVSTVGDRFFGLIYDSGISRILTGSTRFDHIQFGYGAIPEPGTAALALLSAWQLAGRRRSRTSSP